MKMERYENLIAQINSGFNEQSWKQLLSQLDKNGKQIALNEKNNIRENSLSQYIRRECLKPRQNWFIRLDSLIKLFYQKRPQLRGVFYRSLPVLVQRYVQINFMKYQGLQECLKNIYNYEYRNYNEAQIDKSELFKDVVIKGLYEKQLGKEMLQPLVQVFQPIIEVNNTSRNKMKTLIFYLIYREAGRLGEQSLADFYRALFIYCGAQENDIYRTGSLYLLERTNKVSIFRYSISEPQLQWIILTLYQLCTQAKKDKFELLAVINVIHKKVSNQSLFKMSDVANSLIHLLEDQYSEIFS